MLQNNVINSGGEDPVVSVFSNDAIIGGNADAMVAGAPQPAAVAPSLRAACADLPLVMHNAPFDLPFLQDLMRRTGQKPLDNVVVDTKDRETLTFRKEAPVAAPS